MANRDAVEQPYEASIKVRFVVSANNPEATAEAFVSQLAAWVDGSLGSPPFAPWLTAWTDTPPRRVELSVDGWATRRISEQDLADGRLWRDDR